VALHTTPENFRAEISRHMLVRKHIAEVCRLHPNQLTNYINGNIPLPGWAAHNIGKAINELTTLRLFDVSMELDYIVPVKGRPANRTRQLGQGLEPYVSKQRRRNERKRKLRERAALARELGV